MSPARFLVGRCELDGHSLDLRGKELRHLRVRRLAPGDEIILVDGLGRQKLGTIERVTAKHARVRLRTELHQGKAESPLKLALAQAALKADKLDMVIEKTTELGVSSVAVFASSRCVAKPAPSRLDRWRRVAQSAAKQCQRTTVPLIRGPLGLDEILSMPFSGLRLLFWEGARSTRLERDLLGGESDVLAVVGPEGGFSSEEVAAARAAHFHVVGLGPRVLRAETAAIVVVALCQRLWGDL